MSHSCASSFERLVSVFGCKLARDFNEGMLKFAVSHCAMCTLRQSRYPCVPVNVSM